jgi:glutamate 5-kinase
MMSGLSTKGKLTVDSGAVEALTKRNRSLLAAGITRTEGKFQRGDIVNICDPEGNHIGCGITNYGTSDITAIIGIHSKSIADTLGHDYGSEVVHRNNLVIL